MMIEISKEYKKEVEEGAFPGEEHMIKLSMEEAERI
jgi:ketopantoate hydroxymethyltransferase